MGSGRSRETMMAASKAPRYNASPHGKASVPPNIPPGAAAGWLRVYPFTPPIVSPAAMYRRNA